MTTNPYDPDAALDAVRPRLAAVRRRRRHAARGSVAMAGLAVAALAVTTGMQSDDDATAVLAGSSSALEELLQGEDDAREGGGSTTTTPSKEGGVDSTEKATTTSTAPTGTTRAEVPTPQHTDPPPAPEPAPAPPPPPPEPRPAPAPGPVARRHTFTYDGTGSVVVEHEGNSLTLLSVGSHNGWTAHPHEGHDEVKVEFRKDDVSRWLKVRLENGVPTAHRWEDDRSPDCAPPVGTTIHAAPLGAGTIQVTVRSDGTLKLGTVSASAGWQHEIHIANHDTVKVKFWNAEVGELSWVKVLLRDCEIEVETGT